jgi:hypothetical protein
MGTVSAQNVGPGIPDPYYPLGTIGTVPRAYDIFKAYEGMKWRKIQIKEQKNRKM